MNKKVAKKHEHEYRQLTTGEDYHFAYCYVFYCIKCLYVTIHDATNSLTERGYDDADYKKKIKEG